MALEKESGDHQRHEDLSSDEQAGGKMCHRGGTHPSAASCGERGGRGWGESYF